MSFRPRHFLASMLFISLFSCSHAGPDLKPDDRKDPKPATIVPPMLEMAAIDPVPAPLNDPELTARLGAVEVAAGSVVVVHAHSPLPIDTLGWRATLGEMEAPFFPCTEHGAHEYQAVLAVTYSHRPGTLRVSVAKPTAARPVAELPFQVVAANFKRERFSVGEQFVYSGRGGIGSAHEPGLAEEAIYKRMTLTKFWTGPFHFPVQSEITSQFGTSRVFNGLLKSFHSGVDFHAGIGTPVRAAAAGVVVMSKKLFSTGNTIVIDHGYGIFTMYAHLSRRNVKTGSTISGDTVIGLSGNTGRVKGPHLHWGAVIQGVKVNSLDLVDDLI